MKSLAIFGHVIFRVLPIALESFQASSYFVLSPYSMEVRMCVVYIVLFVCCTVCCCCRCHFREIAFSYSFHSSHSLSFPFGMNYDLSLSCDTQHPQEQIHVYEFSFYAMSCVCFLLMWKDIKDFIYNFHHWWSNVRLHWY